MPYFKTLEYKNLQSVGNHPIKIQLDRSTTTLIGGPNGSGKSTMLYAFTYCLYGKFPSGAKLADVINSVNKKNLLTKVEFTERGNDYQVIRGEKPKKFEIYRDGELLDQHAHARDQQKFLELILGMDYKLFTQIVMLNKERYVPFMEMGAADRRKVIEDILDISIFSVMNDIVKGKIKENQQEQANISREVDIKTAKLEGQQRLINEIQSTLESSKSSNQALIKEKRDEYDALVNEIFSLNQDYNDLSVDGYDKVKKQKKEFEMLAIQFEQKVNGYKKNLKFFEENDHCPTCGQDITADLKQEKQHECNEKINEVQDTVSEMIVELEKVAKKNAEFKEIEEKKAEIKNEIKIKESSKRYIKTEIDHLIKESESNSNDEKLQEHIDLYYEIERSIISTRESLEEVIIQGEQLEMMRNILKDDGIKSVIIKEYMALINKKINEYLQAMDFYVNMTLDENFKESFGAINKEKFTMNNLSTGQKMRVNIAIWLAFLEVASIKNSVVSNVLLLDELLENIDAEGVGHIMTLFREKLSDKNIFLVTQRFKEFEDQFRSSIQFKLNEGFTEIV